ncbi:MAG: toxin-antitoxin system TumE family protein [Sinimarinibacterium flocculans]|uniref:toxin-antitoxin system TumE family protein n=1 Tax=Sinimarinibacterium flocculans TaxID=985250 RepID=UPI003C511DB1
MSALPVLNIKQVFGAGFVQMVVWKVPAPVPPSTHGFKYRLVYVVDGERMVGYDNERGKGDHKHIRGRESRYRFVDVATLLDDFWSDVMEASA